MAALYLESSAILSWLFGEPEAERVRRIADQAEVLVTATLSLIEAERALIRAEFQGEITQADRRRLRGMLARQSLQWILVEFTEKVRRRASEPFPVEPVRSLDAIHLASILEIHELYPDLEVLSLDHRILANLEPLGLRAA